MKRILLEVVMGLLILLLLIVVFKVVIFPILGIVWFFTKLVLTLLVISALMIYVGYRIIKEKLKSKFVKKDAGTNK